MTTWWALRSTTKPLGEVALRIDHMVGIAIHHKAVRRGGIAIDHMVGIAIDHKAVRRGALRIDHMVGIAN